MCNSVIEQKLSLQVEHQSLGPFLGLTDSFFLSLIRSFFLLPSLSPFLFSVSFFSTNASVQDVGVKASFNAMDVAGEVNGDKEGVKESEEEYKGDGSVEGGGRRKECSEEEDDEERREESWRKDGVT